MHSLMGQNSVLDKSWKIAFVHYKPEIEDIQESELQTVRNYEEQIQQKYPQQIHILNRRAGRALAQIVKNRRDHALIPLPADLNAHGVLPGVGAGVDDRFIAAQRRYAD